MHGYDALVWVSMLISARLLLGTALALVAVAATSTMRTTIARAATATTANPVASALSQTAKEPNSQTAKEPLVQTAKEPQAKAAAEFLKLDASVLPITQKIQIGGDADWLAIGFGSVWVTVAKNNEVVRVDPVRNVVQARVKVDKEPCYGLGIGVDRVWVLNCQGKTLTRINPQTNAVDMRVPVKIDDSGEGSIAVDERYVWFASNEDGHSSTLSQVDVKTGRKLKGIAVGKDTGVVKLAFGSVWAISSGDGNVYRVNPATRKVTAMITVAEGPRFTTEGAGSLWVLTQSDGNVTRIDPATNKVIDQYGNYPKADGIRYGFGSVWVSDHGKGELWRIDPGKMRGR